MSRALGKSSASIVADAGSFGFRLPPLTQLHVDRVIVRRNCDGPFARLLEDLRGMMALTPRPSLAYIREQAFISCREGASGSKRDLFTIGVWFLTLPEDELRRIHGRRDEVLPKARSAFAHLSVPDLFKCEEFLVRRFVSFAQNRLL